MSKRPLIGGLLAGILVVILAIGVIVAALPAPTDRASAGSSLLPTPTPSPTVAASGTPAVAIGAAAPPMLLTQLGGGTVELAALAGHPVWVDFVSTTCETCRAELARVATLASQHSKEGLVVLVVDVGEDEAVVSPWVLDQSLPLPVVLDPTKVVATAWGVGTLPTHVWIDAKGIVRAVSTGPASASVMTQALGTIIPASAASASASAGASASASASASTAP